jgi:hypothetical protein
MSNIESSFDKIYGVHEGIWYGQNERVDELNLRMQSRLTCDYSLSPNFTPRATPTRQTILPMLNHRVASNVPIKPNLVHHVELNFNSSTSRCPPLGYINNIDIETNLRNQNQVLQHGAGQGIYIPSSKSDLYNKPVITSSIIQPQPFPNISKVDRIVTQIPDSFQRNQIGIDKFHNHTRVQLRKSK